MADGANGEIVNEAQYIADTMFTFMVDDAPEGIKDIDSLIIATGDLFKTAFADKELSRDYSVALDLLIDDDAQNQADKEQRVDDANECLQILRNIGKQVSKEFTEVIDQANLSVPAALRRIFSIVVDSAAKTKVRQVLLRLICSDKKRQFKMRLLNEQLDGENISEKDIQEVVHSMC